MEPPFEPMHPRLIAIWKDLSPTMREGRLNAAKRRKQILELVASRPEGKSERSVLRDLVDEVDRSTFRRWQNDYRKHGFDGLVDFRLPPPQEAIPMLVREAMCTLRRANPNVSVESIIEHVREFHQCEVGKTTVKRVLREAGLSGSKGGQGQSTGKRLELAGMKLLEAASVETGYTETLTKAVISQLAGAERPPLPLSVDASGRDELGRFMSEYNERYRKKPGDVIGPGFASVETKRRDKDPDQFHLSYSSPETVERKMWALMVSPLLGNGHWDGIRVARGALLEELCGYAYMPATLDQFTRELKFLGMSNTLWEVHARTSFELTKTWGELRNMAVLYVDGTTQGIWTELFSQSSKVSNLGRVMPSLETVAFHSGYGVPIWQVTYSGRAPLVKEVPLLLKRLEEILPGSEVERIVVIDAESNSIPFLRGLESGTPKKSWVTRLRPKWVESKEILERTEYQPYRDGERIRMGVVNFKDREGKTFQMRVIEIERRTKRTTTYLGASMQLLAEAWSPSELANLYFDRWPNQEADFRAVNQAVGTKDVHGYGKQLVSNISVVTELDKLHNELVQKQLKAETLQLELSEAEKKHEEDKKHLQTDTARLKRVAERVDSAIAEGKPVTPALQKASAERGMLQKKVVSETATIATDKKTIEKTSAQLTTVQKAIDERLERQKKLDSRREIFRHDTELDSIFAVLKVGLVLLIRLVLRNYLGNSSMAPVTFLERLATLPGRVRMLPKLEIVTFDYNTRDPEVMALLAAHCETFNARGLLTRSGRVLRIAVDPAPVPGRPPPASSRTNTSRRFAK